MNLKTTLVLLVLVVAAAALFWLGPSVPVWLGLAPKTPETSGATVAVLENVLTPDRLVRIEVQRGDRRVILERGADGNWTLPGRWPVREPEVKQLVELVGGLHTRFAPERLEGPDSLKAYGLDQPAVVVLAKAGKDYRLILGEKQEPGEAGRFARPTYLRLDENPEVVRLAPGLVAALDHPADYYQQRRLFPSERVAREPGSPDKVERLAARSVAVEDKQNPAKSFTLARDGDDWVLQAPVRDRVDPDKLNALVAAVPDIWAEQFVSKAK